jgi:hypothetical protein
MSDDDDDDDFYDKEDCFEPSSDDFIHKDGLEEERPSIYKSQQLLGYEIVNTYFKLGFKANRIKLRNFVDFDFQVS